MDTKTCTKCGETKPRLTGFRKNGKTKAGSVRVKAICKVCEAACDRRRAASKPRTRISRDEINAAHRARAAAVIEDIEFMLTHRESMHMASRRVDMKPGTLERLLERHGRHDLARALYDNQYEYTTSPSKEW